MKSTTAGPPGLRHQRRAEEAVVVVDQEEAQAAAQREKSSGSNVLDHGRAKKAAETNKKRLLERKPTEDINKNAEAFINKFRQQLRLERLESIEKFEQMLRRGT